LENKMTSQSRIEWTESTWNPVTGCTKISPGCKNCYALDMSRRLKAMGAPGYKNGFQVAAHPERLRDPIKRRKPTTFFVNSMSDLFEKNIDFEFIDAVFETVSACPQHTFQILTKRAERMAVYAASRDIPHNAWLGVSVENRRHGVPRVEVLRNIRVAVRFLSVEPLLEELGPLQLDGISWVIVGGESGPRARPMKPEWVRSIRKQCFNAQVPFFFKQWGTHGPDGIRRSKKSNGRQLDGQTWDALPV
jgi:protein gp37